MVVGAVLGLVLVRIFMLDTIEEIGWRLFWEALFKGNISTNGMERVFESATFAKSVAGMAAGGIIGYLVSTKLPAARKRG